LYKALLNNAKELGISARQKAWPKAPNSLVRQLNELTPSLKALGWEVVTGVKSGKERTRRILINSVSTVPTVRLVNKADDMDDTDDILQSSSSGDKPIVCPLCASKGQQVTFLTQQDLDIHIQKVHGMREVE